MLHLGWVNEASVEALVFPHLNEYWDINGGSADGPMVWKVFKASTRRVYISAIKAARAEKNSESEALHAHELQCAQTQADAPSPPP